MRIVFAILGLSVVLAGSGCAQRQLAKNTIRQSESVSNIYEQQVLDNLAKFVVNPHALPEFSFPATQSSDIEGSIAVHASPLDMFREQVGLSGQQSGKQAWIMQPVNDANKLRRMRCAYQRAVGYHCSNCPNCCELIKDYLGQPDLAIPVMDDLSGERTIDPKTGQPYLDAYRRPATELTHATVLQPKELAGQEVFVYQPADDPEIPESGTTVVNRLAFDAQRRPMLIPGSEEQLLVQVNVPQYGLRTHVQVPTHDCDDQCALESCWFQWGDITQAPQGHCCKVGHYCGTCVWVPHEGMEQFSRLVLQILEYATTEPAVRIPLVKHVEYYVDAWGNPVPASQSVGRVSTELLATESNNLALYGANPRGWLMDQAIQSQAIPAKAPIEILPDPETDRGLTPAAPPKTSSAGSEDAPIAIPLEDVLRLLEAQRGLPSAPWPGGAGAAASSPSAAPGIPTLQERFQPPPPRSQPPRRSLSSPFEDVFIRKQVLETLTQ